MNVKAQALLNAAKWIEDNYGQLALRDVVRACSEPVRDRYTSAIAINWHPFEELIEFLEVADRLLGRSDGKIAEEIGAAGARSNMKGTVLRIAFYLAKPEYLVRRITQLWRQFNDEGSMELVSLDEQSAQFEVKGIPTPQWLFCCTLTGWARELAIALGGDKPVVKHSMCRARGQARCLWEIRWTGKSSRDMANDAPASQNIGPPSSRRSGSVAPPSRSHSTPPPSTRGPSSKK